MSYKNFLVPVGVAAAALIADGSHASQTPRVVPQIPSGLEDSTEVVNTPSDPVLQKVLYQIGAEKHALLLRKPASGIIYAQHVSHSSHGSHQSHGSHRSGR